MSITAPTLPLRHFETPICSTYAPRRDRTPAHAPARPRGHHRRADAIDTAARIAEKLGDAVDRVRSVAQVGHDVVFVEGDTPVRFQYLMARRHDFTHEEYLDRYETIHSRFGLDTPNIEGYTQFHVDLVASAELAEATGLTGRPSDSVSELHLRSVAHFIEGVTARPDVGRDATRDEERFVDRANSHQFVNEIVARNS